MARIKIYVDTRSSSQRVDGTFPLVLRIGHRSKTRDISFHIYVLPDNFNQDTFKITGITNSVRYTKRIHKIYADVDLWVDENKGIIKLWTISKLKDEIERRFFKKQLELSLFEHAARMFFRFDQNKRFSTSVLYEDGLKYFVKFQKSLRGEKDRIRIRSIFEENRRSGYKLLEEYRKYDIPIKALTHEVAKDWQAYLAGRLRSGNSVGIHLRSLQSIVNDAARSFPELKGHHPFQGIRKKSTPNKPVVLTLEEVQRIRDVRYPKKNPKALVRNIFLFMFNNMGMNFTDVLLAKVNQFDGERFYYTRKKTEREGDNFSIKQNEENLEILNYYTRKKSKDDYIFPLLKKGQDEYKIYHWRKFKTKWLNDHLKEIAQELEIDKRLTSYAARDTWTNLGLQMGIDIRKISSGLGHSSVQVTERHYMQSVQDAILDQINAQITSSQCQ